MATSRCRHARQAKAKWPLPRHHRGAMVTRHHASRHRRQAGEGPRAELGIPREGQMAFDEGLAERIREILAHDPSFSEKRMFGGLAFLYEGRMFVGIAGDTMMARVGPAQYQAALARPHVREMDFTGRPMKGYVFIDPPGFAEDADLREWVLHCRSFVASIPAKAPPKKRRSGA